MVLPGKILRIARTEKHQSENRPSADQTLELQGAERREDIRLVRWMRCVPRECSLGACAASLPATPCCADPPASARHASTNCTRRSPTFPRTSCSSSVRADTSQYLSTCHLPRQLPLECLHMGSGLWNEADPSGLVLWESSTPAAELQGDVPLRSACSEAQRTAPSFTSGLCGGSLPKRRSQTASADGYPRPVLPNVVYFRTVKEALGRPQ